MTAAARHGTAIKRTVRTSSTLAVLILAIGFLFSASAQDKSGKDENFSGSFSGSSVTTGFDFDKDNPSDQSGDLTAAGKQNGGGQFTLTRVAEIDPVPGTGCGAFPAQGCSIDGVTDGCLFSSVGGAGAFRFSSSGDILTFQQTSGTACINPNTAGSFAPPFDFTAKLNWSFNGGSGNFAGATGSAVVTETGQVTVLDQAGHSIGWLTDTYTGTLTKP